MYMNIVIQIQHTSMFPTSMFPGHQLHHVTTNRLPDWVGGVV